jgi:hypothetical protein
MEDTHNFAGGLHNSFNPQNQPKNTYREAYNWVRLEDGSLVNEKGTTAIDYPSHLSVIGSCALGEELIIFSVGEDGITIGEIGILDADDKYTAKITTNEFGWAVDTKIKAVARLDYRGHRLVYFADEIEARKLDLDSIPTNDINSSTKLFIDSILPQITVDSITEDGNLPTGIYQASVRLLTSSLNKTNPTLLTSIIPIVDESRSGGTDNYDGALPQTISNKSINFTVSNLDRKYKFVELIITTYEGLTNTLVSHIVDTKAILGDTISFKYSSLNQHKEEVSLDELTVTPVSYIKPKAIAQKDGRLVLGNLSSRKYNSDLQKIVNNITAKYVIKELEYEDTVSIENINGNNGKDISAGSTNFNNYNDELNTTNYKGYQRDEVYSFAIVPIYKDLSYGYSYHIPGNYNSFTEEAQGPIGSSPADTSTKRMGSFKLQDEVYPTGYGYPLGNVTYHKFPTIDQEPILADNKIRVLGIEFENIDFSSLSIEDQQDIVGYAIVRELRTEENKSILAQGIVQGTIGDLNGQKTMAPWAGKNDYRYDIDVDINQKQIAFFSPETTILNNNLSKATHIKSIALLQGTSYLVGSRKDKDMGKFAHAFMNYHTVYNDSVYPEVEINMSQYISPRDTEDNYVLGATSGSLVSRGLNGFWFIETKKDVSIYNNPATKDTIVHGNKTAAELSIENISSETDDAQIRFHKNGVVQSDIDADYSGDTKRNLFNVYSYKANQYKGVLDKEYVIVNFKLKDSTSNITCFNGDTFIGKTSIVVTMDSKSGNSSVTHIHSFRTLNYFWCESTVNVNYRHNHVIDGIQKVVPYYPKYKLLHITIGADAGKGLLDFNPTLGHANGYNKQYSFENTLKKFYSKSTTTEEEVNNFTNRVIYSEQSLEGEQFDAYRLFLPNNYHDVPKNKGEITNLFEFKSTLFIHTAQSLWQASFNERTTQTSSSGEITLGNGGVFSRPSVEVFPMSGGYAGSIHPYATCVTPFGVIFVDGLQRKVFMFGESFEELDHGLKLDFQKVLTNSKFKHLISGYDYTHDRWILTTGDYTVSYSPKLKSWSSYHNYFPTHLNSVNHKLIVGVPNKLATLNTGAPGNYFGVTYPSSISIVSNDNPLINKSFDNLMINSSSDSLLDTFSYIDVSNESQSVSKEMVVNDDYDYIPLDHECKTVRKSNDFKLSIPVTEEENRIRGKYANLKLTYNNSSNNNFVVKYLTVLYRPVSR